MTYLFYIDEVWSLKIKLKLVPYGRKYLSMWRCQVFSFNLCSSQKGNIMDKKSYLSMCKYYNESKHILQYHDWVLNHWVNCKNVVDPSDLSKSIWRENHFRLCFKDDAHHYTNEEIVGKYQIEYYEPADSRTYLLYPKFGYELDVKVYIEKLVRTGLFYKHHLSYKNMESHLNHSY